VAASAGRILGGVIEQFSDIGTEALRRGPKTAELVARQIVRDIVSRGLSAGDVLPSEATMLGSYRVGRASLREALRVLEINGFVTIKPGPGGGPVVSQPSSRNFGRMSALYFQFAGATFRELAQARLAMEPVLARLAAERRQVEAVSALKTLSDKVHAAGNGGGPYVESASLFHRLIAAASGNRILGLYTNATQDILEDRMAGTRHPPERRQGVHAEHDLIVEAIVNGDADVAEEHMRIHMTKFITYMERSFSHLLDEVVDGRWVAPN
jgi:GntR family transcriptional regulator, transcriptional repressor for pyruvate dehydrogenase complex